MTNDNRFEFCGDHDWFKKEIDVNKADIEKLEQANRKIMFWLIGLLITLVFDLIGIITIMVIK